LVGFERRRSGVRVWWIVGARIGWSWTCVCAAVVVRGDCSMLVGMTRWVGRGVVQRKRGGGELLLLGRSGGADLRCGRADAICGKLGAACIASGRGVGV
jgi:hypothetical protein